MDQGAQSLVSDPLKKYILYTLRTTVHVTPVIIQKRLSVSNEPFISNGVAVELSQGNLGVKRYPLCKEPKGNMLPD